ncbi:MAG TPA: ribulose-phosphate 3-epimerase [Anaerolineales bacterium]|nr:ribulose-phosphate 3-epimerase [Anaerolineales bacterium]
MKTFLIAPSILSADFSRLGEEIAAVETAGADWIHVDIMDGHFVPNMSIGRKALEACKKVTDLPLDVHLMVQFPERFVAWYAESGADRLTVHIEATPNIHRLLQHIRELGCQVGISLNPGTPASALDEVLQMVDQVLVMTVNPGFGGQQFIPATLPKIRAIRERLDQVNPNAIILVDGGISSATIDTVIEAGAQVFVAGNAVFKHSEGPAAGIAALKAHFTR